MAQASYSFLDVAALDGVRERFARGEALVILSSRPQRGDLGQWAGRRAART